MNSLRILIKACVILVLISIVGCGNGDEDSDDGKENKPAFDTNQVTQVGKLEVESLPSSFSFFGSTSSDAIFFSPDNQFLMIHTESELQIYTVAEINEETTEPTATITGESFELTPDDRWLVATQAEDLQIFDLATLNDSPTPVSTISGTNFTFSPDDRWLILTGEAERLFYDLATLGDSPDPTATTTISSDGVVFSPDNQWLVVDQETSYQFYDAASLGASSDPVATITGDSYRFSTDGTKLAVYDSSTNELQFFDLSTAELSDTSETVIADVASSNFGFNPDGTVLVLPTETGVDFWQVASQERTTYTWETSGISWRFSPDESLVVLYTSSCSPGRCSGEMRVLETATLTERLTSTFDDTFVNSRTFSSDSHFLAYGTSTTGSWSSFNQSGTTFEAGTFHLVNLETGEEVQTIENQDGVLGAIFFNSDDSQVVYNTLVWISQNAEWSNAAVHLINVENGEEIWAAQGLGLASGFNDDESQISTSSTLVLPGLFISGGGSHTLDTQTGLEINASATTSDGRLIVSNVQDSNQLAFYNGETKDLWGEVSVEGATELSEIVISPDGTRLVTQYTEVTEGDSPDTKYIILIYNLPALPESE